MNFKEELSYKKIAEELNISCENVRKRISQARKILQQRYDQEFLGEDHSKSGVVSQCELRNNSDIIERIEVANNEDLELSHQENLPYQVNIVVDEQSYRECEEAVQNSDINGNAPLLLDYLIYGKIGKNRLSNFRESLNFKIMQNLKSKIINAMWRIFADSGGRRSLTYSLSISIN